MFKFPKITRDSRDPGHEIRSKNDVPAGADSLELSATEQSSDSEPEEENKEPRRSGRGNRGVPGLRYGILGVTRDASSIRGPSVAEIENLPKTHQDAIIGAKKKKSECPRSLKNCRTWIGLGLMS